MYLFYLKFWYIAIFDVRCPLSRGKNSEAANINAFIGTLTKPKMGEKPMLHDVVVVGLLLLLLLLYV